MHTCFSFRKSENSGSLKIALIFSISFRVAFALSFLYFSRKICIKLLSSSCDPSSEKRIHFRFQNYSILTMIFRAIIFLEHIPTKDNYTWSKNHCQGFWFQQWFRKHQSSRENIQFHLNTCVGVLITPFLHYKQNLNFIHHYLNSDILKDSASNFYFMPFHVIMIL